MTFRGLLEREGPGLAYPALLILSEQKHYWRGLANLSSHVWTRRAPTNFTQPQLANPDKLRINKRWAEFLRHPRLPYWASQRIPRTSADCSDPPFLPWLPERDWTRYDVPILLGTESQSRADLHFPKLCLSSLTQHFTDGTISDYAASQIVTTPALPSLEPPRYPCVTVPVYACSAQPYNGVPQTNKRRRTIPALLSTALASVTRTEHNPHHFSMALAPPV